MPYFEALITINTNPVRKANSEDEFIKNLIIEYNEKCGELFEITKKDIEITIGE